MVNKLSFQFRIPSSSKKVLLLTTLFTIHHSLLAPAFAAAPADKLKATQSEIRQSERRAEALAKDRTRIEEEMERLQEKLVTLAEAARKQEQKLIDLEDQQQSLQTDVKQAKYNLRQHRKEISALVGSLIRLSRIPPEAVIAMPGELHQTMQAASLLQNTTRSLQQKTTTLHHELANLQQAQDALEATKTLLAEQKQEMAGAQEALAKEMKNRKRVAKKVTQAQAQEQKHIALLTRQSRSLQQLLDKLERERKAKEAAARAAAARAIVPPKRWEPALQPPLQPSLTPSVPARIPNQKFASFNAARGTLALPVAGRIIERYGQKLHQNQTSRGLTIASRPGNAVVAPYGGEVVFTGPFLDYGRMVILRYDNGYHLLLAGLSAINCSVGQRVAPGEPIGQLGDTDGGKLYLELRQQSKPVNPSPWFG